LLVQIFAPVGSTFAMAASTDPIAAFLICHHNDAGATTDQAPGLPLSHDDCCGLCTLAHAGALPTVAPAILVSFEPVSIATDWSTWTSVLSSADIAEHARARAPPHLS